MTNDEPILQSQSKGTVPLEDLDQIMPLLYDELRRIAGYLFRGEGGGHALQATEIVHEAYMALAGRQPGIWQDRAHFLAYASQVMRRVLVGHARENKRIKRGAGHFLITLADGAELDPGMSVDVLALDEALGRLALLDKRKVQLVELRYFCGMTLDEASDLLKISRVTAVREWRKARAWLFHELGGEQGL